MPGGGQSRDVAVHLFRATQSKKAGRFSAALAEAHKALRINPRSVEVLCTKAETLAMLGRVDEARHELTKAERFNPRFPHIYILRGCILMDTDENAAEAVAEFEKAYELGCPRIPPSFTFCKALFALGRDDEVMTSLKDAMLDSTDPTILLIRSMYYRRHHELGLALLDANQAVSLLESAPETFLVAESTIYMERGEVRWAMGDRRGAVEDLERALEVTGERAVTKKWCATRLEAFRNTSVPLGEGSGLSNVIRRSPTQT
jgi:tetratricopeptide (TPR) repeat protein